MINKLKDWISYKLLFLIGLLRKHGEYLGILAALLILWIFPWLIRKIDPTAAPIDPGVLSGIVLAVAAVLIFNSVTWWLVRTIWPLFSDYSLNTLKSDFDLLLPWQRVRIYLGFFLYFVSSFIVALMAIL
jgi:hypothetical protein